MACEKTEELIDSEMYENRQLDIGELVLFK